jgi:ubiquinol-cytochrome c reductase cytochrome b subunit
LNIKKSNQSAILLEHLALDGIFDRLKEFKVYSDAITWNRFFGALSVILIILLFLSGAFMAFYYSPVPGAAYDSVDFALFSLPFGGVVKGIHHYSWNLLLIVMGLHLGRAFLWGAYKPPRQLVWITGILIMLVLPLFIITGDLLPWDQRGYWSTQVRMSIIATVPLVGDFLVRMLQGGPMTGIVALTRFYVLHILFLPGMLIFLISIHLYYISHYGLSDPLSGELVSRKKVSFFPNMINRWLVMFLIVTVALGLISWYWSAPLGDPADPTDSTYIPKPEWWVLFLNQLVAIFKGPLTVLGSTIIPGALAGLLIALPYLDSSGRRHPSQRKSVILIAGIIVAMILWLSIMGYIEHFGGSHV